MRVKRKQFITEVGKLSYDFDFSLEKKIYGYVSMEYFQNNNLKIPENLKFTTYTEWKNYVQKKYIESNAQQLENFLHYLIAILKRRKPQNENLKMMVSAVVAFVFSLLTNLFIEISDALKRENIFATFIVEWLLIFVVFFIMFYYFGQSIRFFTQNDMEDNMLKDYINVIEDMLNEKQ